MSARSRVTFRPLGPDDFPRMRARLAPPQMARRLPAAEAEKAILAEQIGAAWIEHYIVGRNRRAIGVLQSYPTADQDGDAHADQPDGTRGLDRFIDEAGLRPLEVRDTPFGKTLLRAAERSQQIGTAVA